MKLHNDVLQHFMKYFHPLCILFGNSQDSETQEFFCVFALLSLNGIVIEKKKRQSRANLLYLSWFLCPANHQIFNVVSVFILINMNTYRTCLDTLQYFAYTISCICIIFCNRKHFPLQAKESKFVFSDHFLVNQFIAQDF